MTSKDNRILTALSLFPSVWLGGVFFFFVWARVHPGFWPDAHVPDPKSLPFEFHHWIFMVALFPLVMSIPCMFVFGLRQVFRSRRVIGRKIAIYLGGWMAVVGIIATPGVDFVS
jgi:hypothetical protein